MNRTAPHDKQPAFDWSDPLFVEDQLGEDERLIRDSARAIAKKG